MQVNIHTVSGRKHTIAVEPTATILSLKEELQQQEGIAVVQQRLLYKGQNLNDEATPDSIHINNGDVLHMVLSLRAG